MSSAAEVGKGIIKLRLLRGDEVVRSYKVLSGSLTIGTAKECTIRAAGDPSLASKHVTIYLDDDALMVVPEQGASVLLNGEPVDFAVPGPDDLLKVGRLTFKVEVVDSLESTVPPPSRARVSGPSLVPVSAPASARVSAPPPARNSVAVPVPAPAPTRIPIAVPVPAPPRVPVAVPVPAPARSPVSVPIPVSIARQEQLPAPERVAQEPPESDPEPLPAEVDEYEDSRSPSLEETALTMFDEPLDSMPEEPGLPDRDESSETVSEDVEFDFEEEPVTQIEPLSEFSMYPRRLPTIPEVRVDPKELEDESRFTTQVITVWQDTVLQFNVTGAGSRRSGRFCVGEAKGCDFPMASNLLHGHTRLPLVFTRRRNSWITIPPEPLGVVTFEDGNSVTLADLVSTGQAEPNPKLSGYHRFMLPPRASAEVDIGEFGFFVNSVARPRKLVGSGRRTRGDVWFLIMSLFAHCLVIFLSFLDVAGTADFAMDANDTKRTVHYNLTPVELEQIEKKLEEEKKEDKVKAHKEQNEVSKLDSDQPTRSYSGRSAAPAPAASVRNVLNVLNRWREKESEMALPVGPVIPGKSGFSIAGAIAGLPTQEVSVSSGGSGLIATLSGDQVAGKGTGVGKLEKSKKTGEVRGKVTKMTSELKVEGNLSREEVSRVVNAHINEIQACYERALLASPGLSGRIVFDWTVMKTGRVTGVRVRSSTLSSPSAASCISSLIKRWKFPSPGAGEVIITYPFLFRAMTS